jgi:mono/diheme cytochrome c family protein
MSTPIALLASMVALVASPTAEGSVDYLREVKPILARHCVGCHGSTKPRAGLRLDTAAGAIKGGRGGPSVVPGDAEESPLLLSILGEGAGEQMPLRKPPLSEAEVEQIRAWIDAGAAAPADEVPTEAAPTHWAFVAPRRPEIPDVEAPGPIDSPIDRFIRARLDREGIAPAPEADPVTLIRRVSLDLIGLPPTPEEVNAFLGDRGPDAYERLVDRLLASPHYGERWARPVARPGPLRRLERLQHRRPRSIWKYRDWVIEALNRDLPFDRFATEQLAADLRPNATPEQLVATGFHRNTPINQEGGIDREQFRVESIIDRANTTATPSSA